MSKASPRFAKSTRYAYMLRGMGIKVHYRDVMRDGFITQEFSIFDGPYIGRRHVAQYLREHHKIEIGAPEAGSVRAEPSPILNREGRHNG